MSSRNGERANAGAARAAAVASAISLNTMLAESAEIRVLSAAYLVLGLAARSLEITRGAAGRGWGKPGRWGGRRGEQLRGRVSGGVRPEGSLAATWTCRTTND